MQVPLERIRTFAIIAHIDHGKSTLADRLLLRTNTISERKFREQVLDDMDLERERGITIKSHPVRMWYDAADGDRYSLNLIDTPGHVDFSYEVSRSLAACDGALVVIDAAKGVQAQTVANVNLAMQQGLTLIPVLNKIDLPAAEVDTCLSQVEELLAIPAEETLLVSAKEGHGTDETLEALVNRIPPPSSSQETGCRALVFDSIYDVYRGVITYIRVFDGRITDKDQVQVCSTGLKANILDVGVFEPDMQPIGELGTGEVGYIITNLKDTSEAKIGDTLTTASKPCAEALPGFKEVKPMVFSGIYPVQSTDYEALKQSISRLQLNDSAFTSQPETSLALGAGFRCGFLGLLHMEIVKERLRREYEIEIIVTYPSVIYKVITRDQNEHYIENPIHWPDPSQIARTEEPIVHMQLILPVTALGSVMNLLMERRAEDMTTETVDENNITINAYVPLQEIIIDFYDKLKSITRGYGSMDYQAAGYRESPLVKLDVLVNGQTVDAFSTIVHRDHAQKRGRELAERLREQIPRQMYQVAIQAVVGGKVMARETVRALRKNVTAKCYGGDITRKRKLLEKQKEGKKKMKQVGKVDIPQQAFVEVLKATE